MEKFLKITKSLKFGLEDLMRTVDPDYEFTLRNVLNACKNSTVPMPVLCALVRCPYIEDYIEEMQSKRFQNDRDIEYLELMWTAEVDEFDGKEDHGSSWSFHGVGEEGYISDDLRSHCSEEDIKRMEEEGWRQGYAIEFSPMYKLANFPIKIKKEICITDWRGYKASWEGKDYDDMYTKSDVQPSITLIELLYSIFWELSFCGSPEQRGEQEEELTRRVDEFDKAKEEGRLDEVCVPWEEVKENLENRFGL